MIVMNCNATGELMNILSKAGAGNLISPRAERSTVVKDWALDNGRFISYLRKERGLPDDWTFYDWYGMLLWSVKKAKLRRGTNYPKTLPRWAIVPDVVTDSKATIKEFHKYKHYIQELDIPLAYAVQDGATPSDVPKEADVDAYKPPASYIVKLEGVSGDVDYVTELEVRGLLARHLEIVIQEFSDDK